MAKPKPLVKGKKKTQLYKLAPHINEGKIVTDLGKKSWRIGKSIGSGGFGEIYTASDDISKPVKSDAPYVAKIEPKANGPLFTERAFYLAGAKEENIENWKKSHKMKFLGMPPYVASGTCEHCGEELRFLIMHRYGMDIGKLFEQNKRKMPFQTVMNLGIKIINILEYIHCQGYIHGDVKGSNLLRGIKKGEEDQVYLVDYGLATKYIKDGVMRRTEKDSRFAHNGTLEFASRDAHLGISSRRSDLEILGYNLLQWLSGTLPWEEKTLTEEGKQPLSDEEVAAAKDNYMKNISKLVARIPKEVASEPIEKYLGYVNSLKIEQEPDYDKCRSIFTEGLKKAGLPNDGKLIFSGTQQIKSKITAEAENQYGKKKQPVRRKGSRKPLRTQKHQQKSPEGLPAGTDSLASDTEDEVFVVKKPKKSKKYLDSSVELTDCATDTSVSGSVTTPNLAGPSGYPTPAMIALQFALRRKKVEVKEKKKKKSRYCTRTRNGVIDNYKLIFILNVLGITVYRSAVIDVKSKDHHVIVSRELTKVVFYCRRSTGKTIGGTGITWGGETLLDLDYANNLSILDESVSKRNELLEVLRVQSARIGLKINVKKTKSLRLGISEDEKLTLGDEMIHQVDSFAYLGSIPSKEGGSNEDVKRRIVKAIKGKKNPSSSETSGADRSEILTPAMLEVIEIRNRRAKTAKKGCKSDNLSKFDKSEVLDTITKNRSKGPPRRPPSQIKRKVLGSKLSPVFKSKKSPLSKASRVGVIATQTSPGIFATSPVPMT
ncbi:serine/threonine-protein kinase VRK1-like [Artemia franciscana]|uniref:serine/threonine-protein kinase VRK1-like n=1 Tax=Artemia franciscana TaxID=6661 RepID=UPI0032DAF1C2